MVGTGEGAGMKVLPYKHLKIIFSSRKDHDDRWIPEAWAETSIGNQVTSHTVPIDSKNSFPTEPEAEAEAEKQASAWIDWIYPSAPR
jgi:hypothetical protein